MGRVISVMLLLLVVGLVFSLRGGCADEKTICLGQGTDCHTFKPVGVFELDDKNPDIEYEVSIGNIVLSVIFVETIIVPIVLCGWYLFEPVNQKKSDSIPGLVN